MSVSRTRAVYDGNSYTYMMCNNVGMELYGEVSTKEVDGVYIIHPIIIIIIIFIIITNTHHVDRNDQCSCNAAIFVHISKPTETLHLQR